MSHDIAVNEDGRYMVYTAGPPPWHCLGQNVAEAVEWREAMELAGLDWEVGTAPLVAESVGDFNYQGGSALVRRIPIPEHVAVIRADTRQVLGVVGKDYKLIQNHQAFEFCDALMGFGALFESAGGLGRGERIWCLARVPQADFAIGQDEHRSFLLFVTSHDGSLSAQVQLTDVRVVCQNTLVQALSRDGSLKIRHTRSADEKLEQAKLLVGGAISSAQDLQTKLERLATFELSREGLAKILERLFPIAEDASRTGLTRRDNAVKALLELHDAEHNAINGQRGTAYNLLNAITDYTDHVRGVRITAGRGDITADQARAEAALFGTGAAFKQKAFDLIMGVSYGQQG